MKKLYNYLLSVFCLSLLSFYPSAAQTLMPLPPHVNTYPGLVRGYYFTAPTNFTMVGLRVEASAGAGDQFIHVFKINDVTPVTWPTLSTNITTLTHITNAPNNVIQSVNIQINAGDIIGILGHVGTGIVNSYSASASPFASTIGSFPVALNRILHQGGLTVAPAPNYSTEPGLQIGRIEMYYNIGAPCSTALNNAIVLGPSEVCPNKNFNLTVGLASGLGINDLSYQWQVSSNGTNWTNFTGSVNPTTGALTDAITAPKWYRCFVTCLTTNQTYMTPPHYVAIAPFYYCYCDGSKATGTSGIDVGNVKVISHPAAEVLLDNGNATPFLSNAASNKSYSEFRYNVPPVPMYHDSSYRFLISQTSSSASFTAAMATIFIDYNRNGTFDTFERILLEPTTASLPFPGLVTDTFKIPDSAGYGLTGMRVILRAGNTSPDSCLAYGDGETEDYLVELRHDPCAGTPTAGVIVGDTSMCVGYEYTLTDSTYQKSRHGLVHSWQRSADAVSWVDIPNSTGKDSIQRLFTGQPLHYRVRMICTATDDTSYSPVHKVNIKPNYKCYCFSQSTGKQSDTSDIGGLEIGPYNYTDGGSHLNNPRAWRPRTDYTDLAPIELIMDSLYSFYIYHTQFNNNHGDGKITVFMDFDNDTKYDIPDERVYTGFTNVGYHTLVSKMQVAEYAIVDVPTGMRVIVNNDVAPNTPSDEACGTYTSGETEDYMVIFRKWPTKVKELTSIEDVDLYPNPTGGRFTVSLKSSSAKEIQVKVSGVTGQQVQEKHYSHQGGRFAEEIDLSSEAKGIYFVEIEAGGEKFVRKLVLR